MFTSHFNNLQELTSPLVAVCISRGKPRWKGGWRGRLAPGVIAREDMRLAPSWAALKASDEEYHAEFAAVLRSLDPGTVFAELGENAVLLCFCEPGKFCHRRLVAEWFEHHLDVIVAELGEDRLETVMCATEHYDFDMTLTEHYDRLEERLARHAKNG